MIYHKTEPSFLFYTASVLIISSNIPSSSNFISYHFTSWNLDLGALQIGQALPLALKDLIFSFVRSIALFLIFQPPFNSFPNVPDTPDYHDAPHYCE